MKPTAFDMPASRRRLTFAAALAVTGLLAAAGCDEQPDSAALNDLGRAIDLASSGDRERSYVGDLSDLQGRQGLSDSTQALVSRAAGDVDRLLAYDALAGVTGDSEETSQPGLLARQLEAIRLTEQLNASARDLILLGAARAGSRSSVQAVQQGVEAMLAKATTVSDEASWTPAVGEADAGGPYAGVDGEVSDIDRQTWQSYTEQRAALAEMQLVAMAGVRQEINRINGEISQSEEQLASLREQRDSLLTRAGARESDAVAAQGDEAVAAAREVADLNIEAGEQQSQMTVEQAKLDELQRDLALAESRLATLQATVDLLRGQAESTSQSLEAANGLQTIDRQIGDQLTAIINGRGESDPGMAGLAEQLAAALDEVERLRGEALDAFGSAATAFDNAARSASTAASNVGRSSGRPAGGLTADAMQATGQSASLALAQTRRQIGDLKLGQAAVEIGLVRLASNLRSAPEGADVSEVEALTDNAGDAFASALSEAVTAFDEATDAASSISGASPEVSKAALTQRAMALSGLAAAARLAEAASSLDEQIDISGVPARTEIDERVAALASDAQSANVSLQPVAGIDLGSSERATPVNSQEQAGDAEGFGGQSDEGMQAEPAGDAGDAAATGETELDDAGSENVEQPAE